MYPDSLRKLIESFKMMPGVGEKSAERYSFSVLGLEKEQVEMFSTSLMEVYDKVKRCNKCNSLTEKDICDICLDSSRDNNKLLIVDDPKNVFLFEKLGMFHGRYHVLDGLINPLEGINPEDIGLEKLVNRITEEKYSEIIFALNPSIEGETTSLYIKRILEGLDIAITRLASGVPIGADMGYMDSLTLERALNDRKEV